LIGTINDLPAGEHFLARFLEESGFVLTASGYHLRHIAMAAGSPEPAEPDAEDIEESA
jgi:hypothetical protein